MESSWYLKAARDLRCRVLVCMASRAYFPDLLAEPGQTCVAEVSLGYTVGRIAQEIAEVMKRDCIQNLGEVLSAHVTRRIMANAGAEASPVRMSPSSLSIISSFSMSSTYFLMNS
jgi:hypothetical protein